jgi:hypothetical protein
MVRLVTGVAPFLLILPVPLLAQDDALVCPAGASVSAGVQSRTLRLSLDQRTRLPYGRDITLLINTSNDVEAVSVRHEMSGGRDGPRAGRVDATSDADHTCWAAAVPPLHLNEVVTLTIDRLARPAFLPGRSADALVADFALALLHLPYPLSRPDLRTAAASAAATALAANFATPADRLMIVAPGGEATSLAEQLAQLASADLNVPSVVSDVARHAAQLARNLQATVDSGGKSEDAACAFAPTLEALGDSAVVLDAAGEEGVYRRLAAGALPWPECARALVASVEGPKVSSRQRTVSGQAVAFLSGGDALVAIADLVRRARALTRLVLSTGTIKVPVGADLLERYTQTDLVTGYLPTAGMWQTFATLTLYAFSPNRTELTASVQPRALGERVALQIGYPVGNPIVSPDTTFEPSAFAAVMYRVNGLVSISLGVVFGKAGPGAPCLPFKRDRPSTCHVAISTNLDVSNLGLFQQLFARKDR